MIASTALALVVLGAPSAGPAAPTDGAALDRILSALRKPKTVRARFVQTKTHPAFDKPQVSGGTVFLARPDHLDFRYERPHKVQMKLQGTRLEMRFSASGRTRTLDLADDPKLGLVFDTLRFFVESDRARLTARYEVRAVDDLLELTPKDAGLRAMITRIRARADLTKGVLRSVELLQSDGSTTVLEFLEPRLDVPRPEAP